MSLAVRVYYDFASPFCYVARAILARLSAAHDLRVEWQPFEVIEYLPPQGAMPQNPAFVRRAEAREIARLEGEYGLRIGLRERLLNSNLGLCAVEYARAAEAAGGSAGLTDAVHRALFEAFYRDERDIGASSVVLEVAQAAGLDDGLVEALEDGRYRVAVARSRKEAEDLGVVAVPTFLAGGYGVVGVPAYDAFEGLVRQAANASEKAR